MTWVSDIRTPIRSICSSRSGQGHLKSEVRLLILVISHHNTCVCVFSLRARKMTLDHPGALNSKRKIPKTKHFEIHVYAVRNQQLIIWKCSYTTSFEAIDLKFAQMLLEHVFNSITVRLLGTPVIVRGLIRPLRSWDLTACFWKVKLCSFLFKIFLSKIPLNNIYLYKKFWKFFKRKT